jgi:DNA-binding NarL/FixJ family response regulator
VFLALIVEDNIAFCESLFAALQARFPFIGVAMAGGVHAAIAELDFAQPDLIFVDLHLGDGSGLDLIRRLRAAGIDSMIVVLTVHDVPEYRDEALRSGADRFMVKGSIDFGDIFDAVDSTLALRFRALVVAGESAFEDRMRSFLTRAEPATVIACATDVDEALMLARSLRPNLVVLSTAAGAERERRFCDSLHADRAGGGALVVSLHDSTDHDARDCPADCCLNKEAAFGQEMRAIVDSLLAVRGTQATS